MISALTRALWSLYKPGAIECPAPTRTAPYRSGLLADVTLPESTAHASVVLVHGGGFVLGSRRMKPMRFLTSRLVGAGLAVCSIDYRLLGRGGSLSAATEDVRAAFEWWRREAPPGPVTVVGLSAGATLALLAASEGGRDVDRLVSVFGLYDFAALAGPVASLLPRLLIGPRDTWHARSPMAAPPIAVPTLFLHGTADGLCPVAQAQAMAARREALGLPTRLVLYDGAPHAFLNDLGPLAESAARQIVEFAR